MELATLKVIFIRQHLEAQDGKLYLSLGAEQKPFVYDVSPVGHR